MDEAILGAYLAGANTRRIRKALAPLLVEEHLWKSAVSRVASRLKELFRRWSERDVSTDATRCSSSTASTSRSGWHKGHNVVEHCPVHARHELKRDYDRIVYAEDGLAARDE